MEEAKVTTAVEAKLAEEVKKLTAAQREVYDRLSLKANDLLGPITALVGVRAGFRCEYCGQDLIGSLNEFFSWEFEHVIPKSVFDGHEDDVTNLALACHTCNTLKSRYDPREGTEGTNGRTFLGQARMHVEGKRQKNQDWLDRVRSAVLFGKEIPPDGTAED